MGIERGTVMSSSPRMRLCSQISGRGSKADLSQERIVRAVNQLYQLLEEYAPSWYTQEHRDAAEAALKSAERI